SYRVEIYNVPGERMATLNCSSGTSNINLTALPAGLYMYRICGITPGAVQETAGSGVSTGKIIIEH
ncbi:MAG: T9SS type A sorting domain-containing protein, partial [Bacteroidia bacterium]|nr:T9SS type A sorting domain-containing protein [Bacteroidia bacterium]